MFSAPLWPSCMVSLTQTSTAVCCSNEGVLRVLAAKACCTASAADARSVQLRCRWCVLRRPFVLLDGSPAYCIVNFIQFWYSCFGCCGFGGSCLPYVCLCSSRPAVLSTAVLACLLHSSNNALSAIFNLLSVSWHCRNA
ncbi:hypothetical protein COO60DRAFT_1151812 [Scenedesmus sp. NREL 46B-D3]|nr:hypothetical protein COO60DRAFT_1151812 [Scenedesmus sp. NREL 46B-D3]